MTFRSPSAKKLAINILSLATHTHTKLLANKQERYRRRLKILRYVVDLPLKIIKYKRQNILL